MLIYDGDCGFCTTSARWLEQRLAPGHPVVSWQSLDTLEPFHLTEHDVTTAAWWIDVRGVAHGGAKAIGRSLLACGGPWPIVGRALLVPPISWIAGVVYRWVARNRHLMPGSTDTCRIDDAPGRAAASR